MTNYRIHRTDPKNIVIQKQRQNGEWRTLSYHGNSPFSLVSGLIELAMAQHTPGDEKMLEEVKKLRLALETEFKRLERMVREYGE